jgi:class 3 adenylate cyclase/tetratricopeptide (TPR) repeat protein
MSDAAAAIETAIAALEAQRAVLGHFVVDTAIGPLRRELQSLRSQQTAALPKQQLKQVSVLFVDVVGSTAIGQRLVPEEIHAVMDTALERFTAAVRAHHGRVLQYTGDGMLAAFGTEAASEDDAESAVRAGLAVIEGAREHAALVARDWGITEFGVRAGIHTGRVLLGAGVDADGSIRGAAVNVAARMEQSAPPGRLRISHDTWRLVRGLFETSELEAVKVKGVEQPVRSYLVERARPHDFRNPTRGIDGVHTRMVGRDAELAALTDAFARATREHSLVALTIVGEPGIGKSRLLAEFRQGLDEADQPSRLLLARAHPRSGLHPYGQLRELFAWTLGIAEDEAPDAARDKFVRSLAPLFAAEGEAPVHALGHLIGFDFASSQHLQDLLTDEQQLRERAFEAGSLALRRLAEQRLATVVLVVDDLHWADEGSLDFARHLLAHNRDMPLLALFLTRPALYDRVPGWGAGDAAHRRIDVRPLDPADSHELAADLLQRIAEVPDALRAIVTGSAEGNPFYMEELVKMLIDDGVIVVEPEGWRVLADKLQTAKVPATLAGVLQARLDILPAPERVALQQAAIVGHVFWVEALAAVDAAAPAALPALQRRQLVEPREQRTGEASGEYVFHHQLLQQVTYDSVLKAPRLQGHARAGAFWRERAEVAHPRQVSSATTRALAETHDHWRRSDPKAFVTWFDGQFTNYLNAYANRALLPLAQSVVELCEAHLGADDVDTARALTNLARVAVQRSEPEIAEPALQRALAIQERRLGPDDPDTARTLAVLGGYYQGRGDMRTAERHVRRAFEIRERVLGDDHALTISTLDLLAHVMTELGRLDEAQALYERVLRVRERVLGPLGVGTASAMTSLAEVLARRGELMRAEDLLRRALAIQQRELPESHPDTGLTLWHLAETLRAAGRLDEAEPIARRTLQVFEEAFGDGHEWTAWALGMLAEVQLALGQLAQAEDLAGRAQRLFERHFGPQHAQVLATIVVQARAAMASGEPDRAAAMLERALATVSPRDMADQTVVERGTALLDQAQRQAARADTG